MEILFKDRYKPKRRKQTARPDGFEAIPKIVGPHIVAPQIATPQLVKPEVIIPQQQVVTPQPVNITVTAKPVQVVKIDNITTIIVNFKTLHLIKQVYRSFNTYYNTPMLLIDNCSNDTSTKWIKEHGGIINKYNLGHGPALHEAIKLVKTKYVFTLDSDCIINKPGFLEEMLLHFSDPFVYAVGWLRYVDRWSGVPIEWHVNPPGKERFVAYLHPAASIYDVEKYHKLAPFARHGAPVLQNMIAAEKVGYRAVSYPVFAYVTHLKAGTRRMYGGRWDPKTDEKPSVWEKDKVFPI